MNFIIYKNNKDNYTRRSPWINIYNYKLGLLHDINIIDVLMAWVQHSCLYLFSNLDRSKFYINKLFNLPSLSQIQYLWSLHLYVLYTMYGLKCAYDSRVFEFYAYAKIFGFENSKNQFVKYLPIFLFIFWIYQTNLRGQFYEH